MSCYKCNNGHKEVPNHYTDEPELIKCDCGDKMDDQLIPLGMITYKQKWLKN